MRTNEIYGLLYWLPVVSILAVGCNGGRQLPEEGVCVDAVETEHYFPTTFERELDILLVIDTSPAMMAKTAHLVQNLPRMVEALRQPKLGNQLPDLRIGVISADLGAGSYDVPGCKADGDGGKLLHAPRRPGCTPPSDPWISYSTLLTPPGGVVVYPEREGTTNVPAGAADPVERLKEALTCIADLGASGCLFPQPLEAARRALDPKLKLNPGFIRKDAFLAVVFITSGDDCSAAKPQLFDPSHSALSDPLGPLTPFRCFEFGVTCDCPEGACDRTTTGPRTNCKPAHDWLHPVSGYADFFKALKPPGRVILIGISGPTDKVEVGLDNGVPVLHPSCNTSIGRGTPAIRIEALADSVALYGHFNEDSYGNPLSICSSDYSPTLGVLVSRIVALSLGSQCVSAPPLTRGCGLACGEGDLHCGDPCLHEADCEVVLKRSAEDGGVQVDPCPPSLFADPSNRDCTSAGTCPCWRLLYAAECKPAADGTPYRFQIMHDRELEKGTAAKLTCQTSRHTWGSQEFLDLPRCN